MAPNLSTLRPLKAGDVILDLNQPLIHVVNDNYKGIYCDYCLKKTISLKRCMNCHQMCYCDEDCQRNDWKYHKKECKIFRNKNFKAEDSDAYQRLLIRLLMAIKSDKTFATKTYSMSDGSEVSLNDIKVNEEQIFKEFGRLVAFQTVCYYFRVSGLRFDAKELLHWLGVIYCSQCCYTMSFPSVPNQSLLSEMDFKVGFGLYIEMCSVSHSCSPNSALIPNGNSRQLRAMKSIDIGSDITISYVKLLNGENPHKVLKDRLLIDCDCQKLTDYLKLQRVLGVLFDLLMKNMDPLLTEAIPDICQIVDRIFKTGEESIGYHPDLTILLMSQLDKILEISVFGNQNRFKAKTEYCERLEKHILISCGDDNGLYRHFKNIVNQLLYPF